MRAGEQAALPPGGRLPAERVLARELDISRSTVVAAYQELRERGFAVTRHGSGTVMRNVTPAAAGASSPAVAALLARTDHAAPLIDLSVGAPDFDDLVSDLTVSGSALPQRARGHGYVPLGWPELRELVAQLLSRRGAPTSPDEVLITNGAQEAISLAVGLVAADGRRVAVESPGYSSALDAIVRAGGQPLAIDRDAAGLRVDSLKQLLERHHVHALYIAPSCNNPTGGRTAPHRRERIVALAADHELTVIEDTVLDELCFDGDPGPPLWALLPERVLAAGSLSKVAWGGLRVGWLRAPRPVILRLARIKGALNIGVGAFDQLAALAILDDYPQLCLQRRAQAKRTHAHDRGCIAPRATRLEHPGAPRRVVTMALTTRRQRRSTRASRAAPRRRHHPRCREQPRRRVPRVRPNLLRPVSTPPPGSRPKTGSRVERPHKHRPDRQPDQRLTTVYPRLESRPADTRAADARRPRSEYPLESLEGTVTTGGRAKRPRDRRDRFRRDAAVGHLVPVTTAVIAAGRGAHELFGDGPRVRRRPVLTMAPRLVAMVAVTAWP